MGASPTTPSRVGRTIAIRSPGVTGGRKVRATMGASAAPTTSRAAARSGPHTPPPSPSSPSARRVRSGRCSMIVAAGSQNGASATTASSSRWAASSTAISPPREVPQTSTRSLTSRRAQASTAAQSSTDWRTISRVQARSAWMKPSPLLRPGVWRRRCRGRSIRAAWAPSATRARQRRSSYQGPGARRPWTTRTKGRSRRPGRRSAVATRCRLPGSPPGPWLGPVRVRTSTPPRRRCCTGPAVIGAGSWTRLAAQNSSGVGGRPALGRGQLDGETGQLPAHPRVHRPGDQRADPIEHAYPSRRRGSLRREEVLCPFRVPPAARSARHADELPARSRGVVTSAGTTTGAGTPRGAQRLGRRLRCWPPG